MECFCRWNFDNYFLDHKIIRGRFEYRGTLLWAGSGHFVKKMIIENILHIPFSISITEQKVGQLLRHVVLFQFRV